MHVTSSASCAFCSDDHKLCHCKKFASEDSDARRNFAQTNKLCFNCLGSGHSVYSCRQLTCCRICKKRHHSLLHPKSVSRTDHVTNGPPSVNHNVVQASITPSTSQDELSNIVTCFSNGNSQVLLATALVKVESRSGTFVLRSLLDQGSQASFITEAAVQMLGLKKISDKSYITGLGNDQNATLQSKWIVMINIQSRLDPSFSMTVKAHVLSKLTSLLPDKKVAVKVLSSQLPVMELADPAFDTPSKIDLLLGAEVYGQILLNGVINGSPGYPIAQHTTLGWILSGQINSESIPNVTRHITSMHTHFTDNEILKKFWELEDVTTVNTKLLTEEEQMCEELYSKNTTRDAQGRYIVKLPFKSKTPISQFGNSYNVSLKRFQMLEKRLANNSELRVQYSEVINEYLTLGHMEVIEECNKVNPRAVYLPHHAVVRKDKKTTQVRVVFDASCSLNNNSSLNSDLMVGPTLQPELRHIVLRWRCYPISLIADIVKMYRQVKVADEDVDFQRLLWRDDISSEIQHLRLLRVTFGTSSAPYLAVRSLQQLSYDEGNNFPLAAEKVLKEFYMDDFISGCETVEEGVQLYREMNELLGRGGFPLQKWSSSDDKLLQVIQSDNGTNFVGASKELKVLIDRQRSAVANDIGNWLAGNGTNWHFIPPRAPNVGGLWEAGVKSTKHHLKRVIGTSTLTFEEMTTLLSQIEACLNLRPISQISNNPEDPYPLTPGHFLIGEPMIIVPDYNLEKVNMSTLKRWHFTQKLVQDFWRRWSQEYLTQLQHRYKWAHQIPEPNIGDVVLVKDDELPPARWLYGVIVDKHVGLDNLKRVVSLRTKGSIIKRLVSKLIILPVTT